MIQNIASPTIIKQAFDQVMELHLVLMLFPQSTGYAYAVMPHPFILILGVMIIFTRDCIPLMHPKPQCYRHRTYSSILDLSLCSLCDPSKLTVRFVVLRETVLSEKIVTESIHFESFSIHYCIVNCYPHITPPNHTFVHCYTTLA